MAANKLRRFACWLGLHDWYLDSERWGMLFHRCYHCKAIYQEGSDVQ